MFKKIVSVILERKISQRTMNIILEFSKNYKAENFLVSLIDLKIIDSICSETGRKRRKVEEEQIMKRYEELYEIEEFFKSKDTFVNLVVKIFNGYEELSSILNSFEPELLIFCEPDERELKEIIKLKSNAPFLIINK